MTLGIEVNSEKRKNLFIYKYYDRHENTPDVEAYFSILFLFNYHPWIIQETIMWSQKFNAVT